MPLLGWQTPQQNMINEGCPHSKSQLDEMSYWVHGLATASFLAIGIIFDDDGPRTYSVCSPTCEIVQENPTITALFQVSEAFAELSVLLSVWLTSSYGVTTGTFFLGFGLLCCASIAISWFALPSNAEAKLLKKYTCILPQHVFT